MNSSSEAFTNLAFLDLETTGLDPYVADVDRGVLVPHHEIIEIGVVVADMKTLEILDTCEQKVFPQRVELMSDRARELNGYDESIWADEAVDLATATVHAMDTMQGSVLMGGNIVFDWGFLHTTLLLSGWTKAEIDEVIYYSKREVTSFTLGRLLGIGEIEVGSFSSRWAEKQLGMEDEPLPHRALNGAMWMYERFKRAYLRDFTDIPDQKN